MTSLRNVVFGFLGAGLGLLVSTSWAPFVEQPSRFLLPTALGGVLIVLVGVGLRRYQAPVVAVVAGQVVVAGAWLQVRFEDLGPLWRSWRQGAVAINSHEAPVAVEHATTAPFLAGCALLLIIVLDALVVGWTRTALIGLPILLALTVPISTLEARLPTWLLLGVLALFAVLLAVEHHWLADDWGQVLGTARLRPLAGLATGLAVAAGVVGLGAAAVLPTGDGINLDRGAGQGRGQMSVDNPMVEIRRGLVNQSHLDMLTASAPRRAPRYLRLAVLDDFDQGRWTPAARDLPRQNRASEGIPRAPGLYASVPGNTANFDLAYSPAFSSRWLALPYPYLSVDVAGDYRYDEDTLDLYNVDHNDEESAHAGYSVEVFSPAFSAEDLDGSGSAPAGIAEEMTALPDDLPAEVTRIAANVVGDLRTDYQRVAALQDWFRSSGGFRYSLWDGPATSGMAALVDFVTTDKVGYCEQFATAMAVMTRAVGVPSRVAVGFGRAAKNPEPGTYVFTGENLHAWTEVYFEGYGWVVFDPTPAVQSGPAPSYSQGIEEAEPIDPGDPGQPSAQPSPTRPDQAPDAAEDTNRDDNTPVWPWLVAGGLGVAAVTPRLLRSGTRRRRLGMLADDHASAPDLADAAWRELEATVLDHRLEWPAHRSPRETVRGLQRQLDLDREQVGRANAVAGLVERARYADRADFSAGEREALRTDTAMLVRETARAVASGEQRKARWLPSSLWELRD